MLWVGFASCAEQGLDYFASRRTDLKRGQQLIQGVASPSQRRYVKYVEDVVYRGVDHVFKKRVLLKSIRLTNIPGSMQATNCFLSFVIESESIIKYDHGKQLGLVSCPRNYHVTREWVIDLAGSGIDVARDVCVRFYSFQIETLGEDYNKSCVLQTPIKTSEAARVAHYKHLRGTQLMFVQFHTTWVNGPLEFTKSMIDGIYSKKPEDFSPKFTMSVEISDFNYDIPEPECLTKFLHDPALRIMWIVRRMSLLVERIQPKIKKFWKGEVIYDPRTVSGRRTLRYLAKGTAKRVEISDMGNKSVISNGNTRHGVCYGAGDFIGMCGEDPKPAMSSSSKA